MALKHVHHVVNRPGRKKGLNDVAIQVADELATVPGIPQRKQDVDFYSRNYPLESQNIEKAADREGHDPCRQGRGHLVGAVPYEEYPVHEGLDRVHAHTQNQGK